MRQQLSSSCWRSRPHRREVQIWESLLEERINSFKDKFGLVDEFKSWCTPCATRRPCTLLSSSRWSELPLTFLP
jgi:hypothetical protein